MLLSLYLTQETEESVRDENYDVSASLDTKVST